MAEVELALARRDGSRVQRARLASAEAEIRDNLRRARSAVELGAADRVAELTARIERSQARRAVIEAELAFQQALADLAVAIELPLVEVERAIGAPGAAEPEASST